MEMTKEELLESKSELIEMLIWAYTQGYKHAAAIVVQTEPAEDVLKEMFAEHMLNGGNDKTEEEK